ncbi:tyrosine-type recombinase/integrase [Paenibacillus qinlingensis]|uniref:tyrosine-type recombinase/integrase n=1 Tax=Paenibacillus qinlingensis TaxID=1837343 RepID=UPI001565B5EB|nr:site-specific integrase [Paenibacillus qinlingensis]NQX62163.1 site-specific integrase [Paenibacillus qinlingensis]
MKQDKLIQALSDQPKYEGKYFSGRKKRTKPKKHFEISDKQRKIDHLSSKRRHALLRLHADLDKLLIANSKVTRYSDGKQTKHHAKKGGNGNLGVEGIWSSITYERYKKSCKTFLKYCFDNFENVNQVRDIKPRMLGQFINSLLEKDRSAKTISAYVSAIQKMAESAVKVGIKGHARLVNEKHRQMIPIARKAERRRGSVGGVGYSLREAQVIVKQCGKHYSIYEQALLELLLYSCPRISEVLKISFDQIDFENKCIVMNKKNQNKNNRPRLIPVPESTLQKLKMIEAYLPSPQTNIWGHRMTEKHIRQLVKSCVSYGKVGKYCGVHDFRKAGLQWHTKRLQKWSKEQLVKEIMQFVGVDPKLNPLIKRDGLLEHKYKSRSLLKRQKRWLINQYCAQLLGHSRNDSSYPYRR